MRNNDSPIHAFEGLPASRHAEGEPQTLLEVRSGNSIRYLLPSRWERLRLRWAFRHFQVLPLQLLNSRDRRLVLRLMQESPATEPTHVDKSDVFGVVETTRWQPGDDDTDSVFAQLHAARVEALRREPEILRKTGTSDLNLSGSGQRFVEGSQSGNLSSAKVSRGSRLFAESWFVRGLATPGMKILCVSVGGAALLILAIALEKPRNDPSTATTPQTQALKVQQPPRIEEPVRTKEPPSPEISQSVPSGIPASLKTVTTAVTESIPSPSTLDNQSPAPAAPVAAKPAQDSGTDVVSAREASQTVASNIPPDRRVTELPQVRLVYPTVSDSHLTGDLKLMAWISADGSVSRVSVLGGDPRLAKSGVRAVLQWRYTPIESSDHTGEKAAEISMKFFGQDAVSIIPISGDPVTGDSAAGNQKSNSQN